MKVQKLLFLFTSLLSVPAHAVIVSGARWDINGKTLVLLGDYHVRTLHDSQQIKIIEKYLTKKRLQVFMEGLPVEKMKFFDFYKRGFFTHNYLDSAVKNNFDLGAIGVAYYKLLEEVETEQLDVLNNIAKNSGDIENKEDLNKFLNNFDSLNTSYHLNSLLDFFAKKYRFLSPIRQVVDIRLVINLLEIELNAKRLSEVTLKDYLKKLFLQKKKEYDKFSEKLQKKQNAYPKLCKWFQSELKNIDYFINIYLESLKSYSYVYSAMFHKGLHTLFNFDCLCYLLQALFFEKNRHIVGIFGADHTEWLEQVLSSKLSKPTLKYLSKTNNDYEIPLDEKIRDSIEKDILDTALISSYIKEVQQNLERDPEHKYYYDDKYLWSVPLKLEQISNLLYPSKLLERTSLKAQKTWHKYLDKFYQEGPTIIEEK